MMQRVPTIKTEIITASQVTDEPRVSGKQLEQLKLINFPTIFAKHLKTPDGR